MEVLTFIRLVVCISVVSYVYSEVITQPSMILNGFYNWLDRRIGETSTHPKMWLFKPLIGCPQCVAGQIGLWFYLIVSYHNYSLWQHLAFVCFAIYLISPVHKFYAWK